MNTLIDFIPNMLTGCNLCAGLLAIHFACASKIWSACALVLASALFDGLDGWAARSLHRESLFGRIFDSVADLISFGCAPVFIYYNLGIARTALIMPFIFLYVTASAVRLIRFNVTSGKHLSDQNRIFEGLPTTASAVLLAMLMLLFSENFKAPAFSVPVLAVLSALMVSHIPFWRSVR